MKYVYLLEHSYELNDLEETKFIGIYSNKQEAEKAIIKLKQQSGFKDKPNNFHISKVEINKTEWNEGFVTIENIQTKDINGEWKTVLVEKLTNGNFRIIENYEDHLLGEFKHNDIIRCELRDGILYSKERAVE